MYVQYDVTIDLLRPRKNIIHVVQDDSTRQVRLTLVANNAPYDITADLGNEALQKLVAFRKSDGTSGIYDTTSDNRQAVVVGDTNNIWIVNLDGACFTAAGETLINVRFMTESGKQLHTFGITAYVEESGSPDYESGDFNRVESIADLRATVAELQGEMSHPDFQQGATVRTYLNLLSGHTGDGVQVGGAYYDDGTDRYPVLDLLGTDDDEPVVVAGVDTPKNANQAANKGYVDGIKTTVKSALSEIATLLATNGWSAQGAATGLQELNDIINTL